MRFLDALAGRNTDVPPVWLMRQAGRYMTSYQKLREKYSFEELALTPELAAQVTLLPIQEFDLDAAILFSDILFPLTAFGVDVQFSDKSVPKILKKGDLVFREDIRAYLEETYFPIYQAIRLVKNQVKKPLIGFAGAPWTLFFFLNSAKTALPPDFETLFLFLEKLVFTHLQLQIEAGCDAVQIFDSRADCIPADLSERLSLLPLTRIVKKLSCPCLFYKAQASSLSFFNKTCVPCALSLDESLTLPQARRSLLHPYTLQGNLDPKLFIGEKTPFEHEVKKIVHSMKKDPGFIFNVSQGLLPQTKETHVKLLVDLIRSS